MDEGGAVDEDGGAPAALELDTGVHQELDMPGGSDVEPAAKEEATTGLELDGATAELPPPLLCAEDAVEPLPAREETGATSALEDCAGSPLLLDWDSPLPPCCVQAHISAHHAAPNHTRFRLLANSTGTSTT